MVLNFQEKQKSKIFNSKTLLIALVVLIFFISVPVFAEDDVGRYQGVPTPSFEDDRRTKSLIWIVDTKLGVVKLCEAVKQYDEEISCSPWTKKTKRKKGWGSAYEE